MTADTAAKILGYMTARNWNRSSQGSAGALWQRGGSRVAVPFEIGYGSHGWPLTCEFCRKAPAVNLVVVDLAWGGGRDRKLACRGCAARVPGDTANPSFAVAFICALTDVTADYQVPTPERRPS